MKTATAASVVLLLTAGSRLLSTARSIISQQSEPLTDVTVKTKKKTKKRWKRLLATRWQVENVVGFPPAGTTRSADRASSAKRNTHRDYTAGGREEETRDPRVTYISPKQRRGLVDSRRVVVVDSRHREENSRRSDWVIYGWSLRKKEERNASGCDATVMWPPPIGMKFQIRKRKKKKKNLLSKWNGNKTCEGQQGVNPTLAACDHVSRHFSSSFPRAFGR